MFFIMAGGFYLAALLIKDGIADFEGAVAHFTLLTGRISPQLPAELFVSIHGAFEMLFLGGGAFRSFRYGGFLK